MKAAEMEIVTWVSINGDKKLCDLVYNDWQLTKESNFGSIYMKCHENVRSSIQFLQSNLMCQYRTLPSSKAVSIASRKFNPLAKLIPRLSPWKFVERNDVVQIY